MAGEPGFDAYRWRYSAIRMALVDLGHTLGRFGLGFGGALSRRPRLV